MFREAIQPVREAEEVARAMRGEAIRAAEGAVEEAKTTGEARVREAVQKAETERAGMLREAEEGAKKQAGELASNLENKKAALGARADASMARAVEMIIGRIVNG